MEIVIFAKKRRTESGKTFYTYLSHLTKKTTGEAVTVSVKFREDGGQPKPENCPCNIIVDKTACNIIEKIITDKNGVDRITRTLWVSDWKKGSEYVDHSMDDYM